MVYWLNVHEWNDPGQSDSCERQFTGFHSAMLEGQVMQARVIERPEWAGAAFGFG